MLEEVESFLCCSSLLAFAGAAYQKLRGFMEQRDLPFVKGLLVSIYVNGGRGRETRRRNRTRVTPARSAWGRHRRIFPGLGPFFRHIQRHTR